MPSGVSSGNVARVKPVRLFARPGMAGGAAGEGLMVRGLPEHFLAGWEGLGDRRIGPATKRDLSH